MPRTGMVPVRHRTAESGGLGWHSPPGTPLRNNRGPLRERPSIFILNSLLFTQPPDFFYSAATRLLCELSSGCVCALKLPSRASSRRVSDKRNDALLP